MITIHLHPTRRFWEADGLPTDMWNDGPLQRLIVWLNGARPVEVLQQFRPQHLTVYAVYPQHRQSSLLVRASSDFLVECFREADA